MADEKRPNPSFFVITVRDPARVPEIETGLSAHLREEEGRCLKWIGEDDYAVARAAGKQLQLERGKKGALELLGGLDGVEEAKLQDAQSIMQAFSRRVPAHPVSAA